MTSPEFDKWATRVASVLVETLPGRVRDRWHATARAVLRRVEEIVDQSEESERIAGLMKG